MKKIQIIDTKLLENTTRKAKIAHRLRMNHNFHSDLTDPINRMLNALEPDTYIQPHKHENPDKREVFIVLKGSFVVFFFDDEGNITQQVELSNKSGTYGVDIPPGVWHTLICLESESVAYEIKDGPYIKPSDKNFASWAPKEGDDNCSEYLKYLKSKINQ